MAKSPRYLTKSRFKSALECPTKLYYTRKEEIYANKSKQDKFLKVLAEGGYQVGELAKYYHPDGCEVLSDGDDDQLKETSELLQKQKVIIYEPAIKFENFFIRVKPIPSEPETNHGRQFFSLGVFDDSGFRRGIVKNIYRFSADTFPYDGFSLG